MRERTMTSELADDIIYFAATPVSPFILRYVPALGRLYRVANTSYYRLREQFVSRLAGRLFRALHSIGIGGSGVVGLRRSSGNLDLRFDVRNTQFHALYMPQHLPCYEPETTVLIERLTKENDIFFDIGANWGWYTILTAVRPGFAGAVHAFEPNPPSFADLVGFVSQAGLSEHVHCHNLALGNEDGETAMSMSDGIHSGIATLDERGGIAIKVARLDSLELPIPNVIKMDVEDHEYEVLLGAERVIAKGRPFVVFESWSYPQKPEITSSPLQLLEGWNYRMYFLAWLASNGEPYQSINWSGGPARFGLVPFRSLHRGILSNHANLVAIPIERVDEVRVILSEPTD
jgi:FkbM family methyltransferase